MMGNSVEITIECVININSIITNGNHNSLLVLRLHVDIRDTRPLLGALVRMLQLFHIKDRGLPIANAVLH